MRISCKIYFYLLIIVCFPLIAKNASHILNIVHILYISSSIDTQKNIKVDNSARHLPQLEMFATDYQLKNHRC